MEPWLWVSFEVIDYDYLVSSHKFSRNMQCLGLGRLSAIVITHFLDVAIIFSSHDSLKYDHVLCANTSILHACRLSIILRPTNSKYPTIKAFPYLHRLSFVLTNRT